MPTRIDIVRLAAVGPLALFAATHADSQASTAPAEGTAAEVRSLEREHEARIAALEARIEALEAKPKRAERASPRRAAPRARLTLDNAFNPSIGVILDGRYARFSSADSEIPGFAAFGESERGAEGFSLGHSEVTVSSDIDDKFHGYLTLGIDAHPGESTELELEEAFIQTLPGAGLPDGMRIKAGRSLWTLGYLNELHAHTDDFADRPLPYQAFFGNAYNDDGVELSYVLPTGLYSELGGGLFRGDDAPFGDSSDGRRARSAYARLGGDIGRESAWRIGAYLLDGDSIERVGSGHGDEGDGDGDNGDGDNGDGDNGDNGDNGDGDNGDGHGDEEGRAAFFSEGAFTGSTRLYGVDLRYVWTPTGNARDGELVVQGEYFRRDEKGTYALAEEVELDAGEAPHREALMTDAAASGWYAQAVYRFLPRWRIGARYARLSASADAELGRDPCAVAVMADWTNSEFGRIRLQFNREALAAGERDDQVILQYVMSLGAHAAHTF